MKIRCDACEQVEAVVFCSADEAALCEACDVRVHHANKLAGKHIRFPLLHPKSSKEAPICDVCQERRAFLFCKEDRAILCRECDLPIHQANEHTQKHSRFLLTGVKLSDSSGVSLTNTNCRETLSVGCSTDEYNGSDSRSASGSSMSEYMENFQGWVSTDFLDASGRIRWHTSDRELVE